MPRFAVAILRTVCFEREVVVEAADEEHAKAIARQMAPNLVFDRKYPTEHEAMTAFKVPQDHPTTKELLDPSPFDILVKHLDGPVISMR